jgi:hypothetical protein
MARIKNVESFCSFCGTVTKMEISGDYPGSDQKKWARCKKCKQKMVIDIIEAPKEEKPVLEGIENEQFTVYAPTKSFSVGDPIYHQSWDDYGRVVSKDSMSDGRSSITVEFQKNGLKRLIESFIQQ